MGLLALDKSDDMLEEKDELAVVASVKPETRRMGLVGRIVRGGTPPTLQSAW